MTNKNACTQLPDVAGGIGDYIASPEGIAEIEQLPVDAGVMDACELENEVLFLEAADKEGLTPRQRTKIAANSAWPEVSVSLRTFLSVSLPMKGSVI